MVALRVDVPAPLLPVHRHPSEEGPEEVVELLVLGVLLVVLLPVLRPWPFLLRSEAVVVGLLLCVDEDGVGVGDFFEDFFCACVDAGVPSYWFLSGWKRRARLR